jgi:hypothetical protein
VDGRSRSGVQSESPMRFTSGFLIDCRQRPTLPHSFPCSTIGGIRLNFRVRNGNGCDPDPMTTGILDPDVVRNLVLPGVRLLAASFTSGAYRSKPIVPDNLSKSIDSFGDLAIR